MVCLRLCFSRRQDSQNDKRDISLFLDSGLSLAGIGRPKNVLPRWLLGSLLSLLLRLLDNCHKVSPEATKRPRSRGWRVFVSADVFSVGFLPTPVASLSFCFLLSLCFWLHWRRHHHYCVDSFCPASLLKGRGFLESGWQSIKGRGQAKQSQAGPDQTKRALQDPLCKSVLRRTRPTRRPRIFSGGCAFQNSLRQIYAQSLPFHGQQPGPRQTGDAAPFGGMLAHPPASAPGPSAQANRLWVRVGCTKYFDRNENKLVSAPSFHGLATSRCG